MNRLVVEMPDARPNGPLAPVGSVGRKSHGVREIVASRTVGCPVYSAADIRPRRDPMVAGTTNRTAHAPFQAKPGGIVSEAVLTRTLSDPTLLNT